MRIILSPAKKQKTFEQLNKIGENCRLPLMTQSIFEEKSSELAAFLATLSPAQLAAAMRINDELAMQTFIQYQNLTQGRSVPTPALWTYVGLVYRHLAADRLTQAAVDYACRHVRILDALYGVLRPTDGIVPYRLDMLAKVKPEGKNLYRYWEKDWAEQLMEEEEILVNLASNEFSKAVLPHLPASVRVIDVEFKTMRKGKLVVPTTLVKMARGAMTRFLCERQISTVEEMTAFDELALQYREDLSTADRLVFVQRT